MTEKDFEIQASGLGYVRSWQYEDGLLVWGDGQISMSCFIYFASLGATMDNYTAEILNAGIDCLDDKSVPYEPCSVCCSGVMALKAEIGD